MSPDDPARNTAHDPTSQAPAGPLEQEIHELLHANTQERQALTDQGRQIDALASVIHTQNVGLIRLARAIDALARR